MPSSVNYGSINVGALQFTNVLESESDFGSGQIEPFTALTASFSGYSFGFTPQYVGVAWTGFSAGVAGSAAGTAVSQVLTFSYDLSAGAGGTILGFQGLIISDTLSGADASVTANETISDSSNNTLATYNWTAAGGSTGQWLSSAASNVQITVQVTNAVAANVNGNSNEYAIISGLAQGFVYGSVAIDKQVSVDGGRTWLDQGNGNTADSATSLAGCPVEYRVLVSNDSSSGVTFTGSVTDAGGPNFTFGGSSGLTLAAGATATSDVSTVSSAAGAQFDTATVAGTVGDGNGHSGTVTASDVALYTGVNGSVAIDKQISVDGGNTWTDVGNGVLNAPTIAANGTIEYRVLLTNTGPTALDNVSVGDSLGAGSVGTAPVIAFTTQDAAGTLAVGQTVTSDIATAIAAPGHNFDVATVTANAVIQDGPTLTNSICTVTASDTADYTGNIVNPPTGSITIDKQVSVDGGNSWLDVGNGNTSDIAQALAGCPVEYKVIVTNTSSTGVGFTGSVTDVNGPNFTFGGSSTVTVAAGGSATSDLTGNTVSAISGRQFDTATVAGTVSNGSGFTNPVSASDIALYTGVNGSVSIDKQVSVDGGNTWKDVGNGVLNAPSITIGANVEYRVLLTNTGTIALDKIAVTDALAPGSSGSAPAITFNTQDAAGTLAVGQTVTSDIASAAAVSGHNLDVVTLTAKGVIQDGTTTADSICNITATDTADYTGTVAPTGSITIDKQVSVDGGNSWLDIGNGNTSDLAQALAGCPVEYKVIVTNVSSTGVGFTGSVTDVNGPNFTFGGSSTVTVAAGGSVTSDLTGNTVSAISGQQFDTATVAGTVSNGSGFSAGVSAHDIALYTGVNGSVSIDKQVSVDGGNTWKDVGNGVLQGPSIAAGANVEYRVLLTNTGTIALDKIAVTDALAPGSSGSAPAITFNTQDAAGTLAVGQTVTSDIASAAAVSGHNLDVVTLTAKGVIQDGTTTADSICNITATDTADYTGTVAPTGSITIDKQVSVDCGNTWKDVGKGVLQNPTAETGDSVQYRVVVTDTGTTALTGVTVGDIGGGNVSGFTFGGSGTISLAAGQSVTSDASLTPTVLGHQVDIATVTGTISGTSGTVSSSDTADYTGVKGNVSLDKQVSTDGTHWSDVGNGVLNGPTVIAGGTLYYRVIVTDIGSSTITGITVTDVGNGAPSGFSFNSGCNGWGYGCNSGNVTLNAGQSITSCVVGVTSLVGSNSDTATVTGTITTGNGGWCGGGTSTTVEGCDVANYTGIKGSLTIDKQVSVDGGNTWKDVGNGNLQSPTALIGCPVDYRVVLVNTGTTSITGVTVGDAGGGSVTGFNFGTGNATSITLAAGQTITSNVGITAADCGYNLDTATATGTISAGGSSVKLTASDQADYKGITGAICIDKQVSVDGGKTWQDVGNNYDDPSISVGSTVDFRVLVSNTGGLALSNVSVGDANGGTIKGFTFNHASTLSSLAVGQTVTSDIAGTKAVSGCQVDTATASGTVALNGCTATVTATDQAEYTGGSNGGGSCGNGWGGGGSNGGGWGCGGGSSGCGGNSGGSQSNGYGCGSDSGCGNWGGSSGDLCGQYGQAQQIEFCYNASDCVSQQGLQGGLASCSGHDGYNSCYITVTNCANAYQSGASTYFCGNESSGHNFYADCTNTSSGCFSNDLYVHVFSSAAAYNQHQSACQTDTYVCGGSQQINLGDQVGCATVVGYVGHSGSWCV